MTHLLRFLALVAIATLLALPSVGDDGGENGSGIGVWVLPRATHLAPIAGCAPRATYSISAAQGCRLQMSDDIGVATATLVESTSGTAAAVAVVGREVRIPSALLLALKAASATAMVVVTDAEQVGYVIQITASPDKVLVSVY